MSIEQALKSLERTKPSSEIPVTFFVGSLFAIENGLLIVYNSMRIMRLQQKSAVDIDIIIRLDDIHKMKQNYERNVVEIFLKPPTIHRINDYLEQFDHNFTIIGNPTPFVEIRFKDLPEDTCSYLQNFFSSVTPYHEKKLETDNNNANEDIQLGSSRASRKKKKLFQPDEISAEPEQKRARKRKSPPITIDLCDTNSDLKEDDNSLLPKRTLRSRRAKAKISETILINDDDVSAKEERELEVAIALSLKTNGNNGCVEEITAKSITTKIDPYEHIDKTIELFRYPFIHGIDNEIAFKMEDYLCLGKAEYLSDVIIDFFFSYFYNEKFTDEMREKVYVFPSSFYSIYSTSSDYPGWNSEENANKTALQKRYERVEGMLDLKVNIFDKEFLVFPLFQSNHWFLSIVCFPKLTQNLLYADDTPTEDCVKRNQRRLDDPSYNPTPLKWSCILTFDSVKSNASRRSTAMKHIRGFLNSHYERFYKDQFELGKLTACSVQCPLQPNNVDCGCFIIEFFERFFVTDPFNDFRLPLFKKNWFKPEDVRLGKRREIVDIVRQKMENYCFSQEMPLIELPELRFPSEQLNNTVINEEENGNDNEDDGNNKEENGSNNGNNNGSNNNDEEFNNNNDFNCLNSNRVANIVSTEPDLEYVCSPKIVDDHGAMTAEQMFDSLRAQSTKNLMNIDTQDELQEKEIRKIVTEKIPDNLMEENCGEELAKRDNDVEMKEIKILVLSDEIADGEKSIEAIITPNIDNDIDMKEIKNELLSEASNDQIEHSKGSAMEEEVIGIVESCEVKVEQTEVTIISDCEEKEINTALESLARKIDESGIKNESSDTVEDKISDASLGENLSKKVEDNSEAIQESVVEKAYKKNELCDNDSSILSD